MTFLDCIADCNRHDLSRFTPFHMASRAVGWIRSDTLPLLRSHGDVFDFDGGIVSLAERFETRTARSRALLRVARNLDGKKGVLPPWRDELYPVFADPARADFTADSPTKPLAHVTRSAVLFFGLPAWGVHLNGYVEDSSEDGDGIMVWLARRGPGCCDFPGKLDNLVAGGQPAGLSADDNLAKEAREEAGIGASLLASARPQGCLSYLVETPFGLSPGNIFSYDVKLPPGFTPRCHDGEVAEFLLQPAAKVREMVATTAEALHFKPNSALVILDFLLRHGVLDRVPDRADIAAALGREA